MAEAELSSYLRNCVVMGRPEDGPVFEMYTEADGEIVVRARLDGYVIVPKEIYAGHPKLDRVVADESAALSS